MGRDAEELLEELEDLQFQSTRPHGARLVQLQLSPLNCLFQSTRPHGARQQHGGIRWTVEFVSIHAPAWGATRSLLLICGLHTSFNPRARMGRDTDRALHLHQSRVSIHAPAWGATTEKVSNHDKRLVSIHAPAWGATPSGIWPGLLGLFQSTRPHGARHDGKLEDHGTRLFQSTRPHGARRLAGLLSDRSCGFQSTRPHGARRKYECAKSGAPRVSIHAPAWGATACGVQLLTDLQVSIHAPAWGATEEPPASPSPLPVSIHAPAWGATACLLSRRKQGGCT